MATTGLSYTTSEITGSGSKFPHTQGFPYNNFSVSEDFLSLEPSIHELLNYEKNENNGNHENNGDNGNNENSNNHQNNNNKNSNNIHINDESFHSKYEKSGARTLLQNDDFDPQNAENPRRPQLSEEIKNVIHMEHKRHMILSRVSTYVLSFIYFYFYY